MATPPNLLNDDGSASRATALMLSHHGFRRDLELVAAALPQVDEGRGPEVGELREEWRSFGAKLHGHHVEEDTFVVPAVLAQDAGLGATVDRLVADHRLLDPVLEEGDTARSPHSRRWRTRRRWSSTLGRCSTRTSRSAIRAGLGFRGSRCRPNPDTGPMRRNTMATTGDSPRLADVTEHQRVPEHDVLNTRVGVTGRPSMGIVLRRV